MEQACFCIQGVFNGPCYGSLADTTYPPGIVVNRFFTTVDDQAIFSPLLVVTIGVWKNLKIIIPPNLAKALSVFACNPLAKANGND